MICGCHSGGYEQFYHLGYNASYSGEITQIFRRSFSLPHSELHSSSAYCLLHDCLFLDLRFNPDDVGDLFL